MSQHVKTLQPQNLCHLDTGEISTCVKRCLPTRGRHHGSMRFTLSCIFVRCAVGDVNRDVARNQAGAKANN